MTQVLSLLAGFTLASNGGSTCIGAGRMGSHLGAWNVTGAYWNDHSSLTAIVPFSSLYIFWYEDALLTPPISSSESPLASNASPKALI